VNKEEQLSFLEVETKKGREARDWSFKDSDTQYLTHGLHPYPARMIPQIAGRLIELYLDDAKKAVIADVFCGSGTVNVEASLRGFKSIGIDINPFAVLLSSAKLTKLDGLKNLHTVRRQFAKRIEEYEGGIPKLVPEYKNIEHWFKRDAIDKLSYLKGIIKSRRRGDLRKLLWIAFANTLMRSSNVDWKSSRYIRVLPSEKLRFHNPHVFLHFQNSLIDLERRIERYSANKREDALIIRADARRLPLADNSVDIVITSPPYGEERNTIPYVRWSKLFLLWLGMASQDIATLEKQALGGEVGVQIRRDDIPSKTFWATAEYVSKDRIRETIPFMKDYVATLKEMKRILRAKAMCCIVIGHRSISRNVLDMGKVTQEIGDYIGLRPENLYRRLIPKKMIPWSTPTGQTILDESIVILKKERPI
jgi:site-specific DNA-methyltransferase (cytosine-N4-specific)